MTSLSAAIPGRSLLRGGPDGALVRAAAAPLECAMAQGSIPAASAEPALDDCMIAVARGRDRAAFARLFGHFAPRLKGYFMRQGADRAAAEELAQEVMLTVWRRAETYDPAQAAVSTWIFTIARNKRIDRLRRERRPEIDPSDPALVPDPPARIDDAFETAEAGDRLRRVLGTLPQEQAELLRLSFFEDKSHAVIAAQLRLPLGTVKSKIRAALLRLRMVLQEPPE
jgi:RNA polymerase sigma-70 factor (ECF subfamily)